MQKISFSSRFWIVGCIRFENELVKFTEINKFTWKNPKENKDQLEICSSEPNITRPSYEPNTPDDVEPHSAVDSTSRPRPYNPFGNDRRWRHHWDNKRHHTLRSWKNILRSGK